jgi:hypothetical protein
VLRYLLGLTSESNETPSSFFWFEVTRSEFGLIWTSRVVLISDRALSCAVRASAKVNGVLQHQIFVYGGQIANQSTQYSDVYILTVPSYTWTVSPVAGRICLRPTFFVCVGELMRRGFVSFPFSNRGSMSEIRYLVSLPLVRDIPAI